MRASSSRGSGISVTVRVYPSLAPAGTHSPALVNHMPSESPPIMMGWNWSSSSLLC